VLTLSTNAIGVPTRSGYISWVKRSFLHTHSSYPRLAVLVQNDLTTECSKITTSCVCSRLQKLQTIQTWNDACPYIYSWIAKTRTSAYAIKPFCWRYSTRHLGRVKLQVKYSKPYSSVHSQTVKQDGCSSDRGHQNKQLYEARVPDI